MPNYRSMIEDTLKRRGLPVQLTAMVLSESAFDNEARPNRPPEVQAAGVWQIIPGSARALGLTVSPVLDERLEPRRATEAAAQYLTQLHARFGGDWALAIAAYNGGRRAIEDVIAGSTGAAARDKLLASKTEFGGYLASVMISMLIMEEPSLLD
jgi:membrane-bound lytic murein transglycosylase D